MDAIIFIPFSRVTLEMDSFSSGVHILHFLDLFCNNYIILFCHISLKRDEKHFDEISRRPPQRNDQPIEQNASEGPGSKGATG